MKEFNLNSAEKYKDGSPMMSDLPVQLVRLMKRIAYLEKKVGNDDRIEICEGNIEDLDYRLEEIERKLANIMVALKYSDLNCLRIEPDEPDSWHTGSDFCGNCAHCDSGKQGDDTIHVCDRTAEIIDPDDASCSHYEENFGTKPDREECKHCPKSQCDNCMNFPF